jgi:hypothetical protein
MRDDKLQHMSLVFEELDSEEFGHHFSLFCWVCFTSRLFDLGALTSTCGHGHFAEQVRTVSG